MRAPDTPLIAPSSREATSGARLDRLITVVGQPEFGNVLYDTLYAVAAIDRCLVFEQAASGVASECILDQGSSAKASLEALIGQADALVGADASERRRRAQALGAADAFAVAATVGRRHYLLLALSERNGLLSAEEISALHVVADVALACAIKDRRTPQDPFDRDGVISGVILRSGAFERLTSREKSVCVGILTGHTTEAIALHLGISANSVLTFRRRLYQKLGICSQNDLFMRVLETAKSL